MEIEHKNSMEDNLMEFFSKQYELGMAEKFKESLQEDFNKILNEFKLFMEKKCDLRKYPIDFDFFKATTLIIQEIYSFKHALLRSHTSMLMDASVNVQVQVDKK